MKVTAFIADDEPVARGGLRGMLAAFDWVEVVGEAGDGESAARGIRSLEPELVFLDVRMPAMLGIDVFRRIEHRPFVMFTTAYSEHAVTAFELGAVDYLLKPFGAARLAAAMERVRASIGEPASTDAVERLSGALAGGPITRLFVRVGGAIVPLAVERVSWFEADGDYVIAHAGTSRHAASGAEPTGAASRRAEVHPSASRADREPRSRARVPARRPWWVGGGACGRHTGAGKPRACAGVAERGAIGARRIESRYRTENGEPKRRTETANRKRRTETANQNNEPKTANLNGESERRT